MGYDITPSENENIVMTIAVIGTRDQVGLLLLFFAKPVLLKNAQHGHKLLKLLRMMISRKVLWRVRAGLS